MDIKGWFVAKLDADKNGKVNLDDAKAKYGAALVNAVIVTAGIFSVFGFFIGKLFGK